MYLIKFGKSRKIRIRLRFFFGLFDFGSFRTGILYELRLKI
jgi:hypothetical protein